MEAGNGVFGMRLFIAIELSEEMKKSLLDIQEQFRRLGVHGNYTRPENLHLTLAFIGEYSEQDKVLEAMSSLCFRPVELRLRGLGSFGELWWAGLEENGELSRLVTQLRRALARRGIPYDRKKFLPHITLVRKPEFRRLPDFASIEISDTSMKAERVSLMLSTRGKCGMIYTELGALPLQCRDAGP